MTSPYQLPDLPYDYSALKPAISPKLLELHHSKHHAAYVKGANETLDKLSSAREDDDFSKTGPLSKALAFHVSGHVLHSIFWTCMSPNGAQAGGKLQQQIEADFGSADHLKKQMNAAIAQLQGSGWAALAWEPVAKRLIVEQVYDHQSNVGQGAAPVFVIDGWEHAFYLDYLNDKAAWTDAFWEVADFTAAGKRLETLMN